MPSRVAPCGAGAPCTKPFGRCRAIGGLYWGYVEVSFLALKPQGNTAGASDLQGPASQGRGLRLSEVFFLSTGALVNTSRPTEPRSFQKSLIKEVTLNRI